MKRVRIEQKPDGFLLEIAHPESTGWLVAGLVDVTLALGFALASITGASPMVSMLLLPFGMISLVFLPYGLFLTGWLSSGLESLHLSNGVLTVRSSALGIPWHTRRFDLSQVLDIRYQPIPNLNRRLMHTAAVDPGSIAFDYGGRTMRFGRWLDPDEARYAIGELSPALERARSDNAPVSEVPTLALPASRHRISRASETIIIRMPFGNTPLNRRVLAVGFGGMMLAVPLMGVAMGGMFTQLGTPQTGTMVGVVFAATLLIIVVPVLAVSLSAKEIVSLSPGVLEVKTRPVVLTLLATRRFDTRYIHNLRYEPVLPADAGIGELWSTYFRGNYGQIVFGYGAEQHRFGQYIDGPEAQDIAMLLNVSLADDPAAGSLARAAYDAAMAATGQPIPQT